MTIRFYIIIYPHPEVPPRRRILRLGLEPEIGGDTVLERLCDTYPDQRDDLKDATLWKASELVTADVENSNQRIYEWIKEREKFPENEIKLFEAVEDHFPDRLKPPSGKWVNIVVVTPEIIEDIDYQGDVDGNLRHIRGREELSRTMKTTGSPSESVKSHAAIGRAVNNPAGPRYGRPSDRFGPPTALFNKELALLRYDLGHLEAFTPDSVDINNAFVFTENAVEFFTDESKREAALRPILGELLPGKNQWQMPTSGGSARPDGVWLEGSFAYLVAEVKNEPGLGGDPFLQGLLAYSKILAQDEYLPFLNRSNLPVVLLAIAGNCLVVSTAIFTDSIYVDKLVSVDLHFGPHASDNVVRVARTFIAINKCTERLRELYSNLIRSVTTVPPAKIMWPNPTVDPSEPAEGTQELEFFAKVDRLLGTPINRTLVDEENKRHAIYLARMRIEGGGSTTNVLVKFAVKYNAAAHLLLASHDPSLAPALYSCKRVIGDMLMVVMQYIPNSEGTSLHNISPPPSALEPIRRDLSRALELLHEENLVFGDLRELNVLYLPEKGRTLLIDFDGVGRDGEDRYSACLNRGTGLGVKRFQIMERLHDVENLGRLMDRLSGRL